MASDRLKEHYEKKYVHEVGGSNRIVEYRIPSNRFEAALYFFVENFKGGNILEIGGGDGTVARSMLNHGLKFDSYTLTDLSDVRAKAAARSLDDPRFHGFQLDVENDISVFEGRKFDAVIMIALIEHLIDPIGALKNLSRLLADDGFIYIDTPNIAKYSRRLKLMLGKFPSTASSDEGLTTYDGRPVDLYDEGHLHYWTFRSMEKMLSRYCGLQTVVRTPYTADTKLPRWLAHQTARVWPEAFSEVAMIVRK